MDFIIYLCSNINGQQRVARKDFMQKILLALTAVASMIFSFQVGMTYQELATWKQTSPGVWSKKLWTAAGFTTLITDTSYGDTHWEVRISCLFSKEEQVYDIVHPETTVVTGFRDCHGNSSEVVFPTRWRAWFRDAPYPTPTPSATTLPPLRLVTPIWPLT